MVTFVLAVAVVSVVVVALQASCFISYDASKSGETEQVTPVGAKASAC